MLPESGSKEELKHAVLMTVFVWRLQCGHKVMPKPDWMDYTKVLAPVDVICPCCWNASPDLIYLTGEGLSRVLQVSEKSKHGTVQLCVNNRAGWALNT